MEEGQAMPQLRAWGQGVVVPVVIVAALMAHAVALATPPRVSAQTEAPCFSETGRCLSVAFRAAWEGNGGVAAIGFPITAARPEVNRDTGQRALTQWFERNRLELHPEGVLFGRLGDDRLRQRGIDWQALPKGTRQDGCDFFTETGHTVCDQAPGLGFKTYWNTRGGLPFFGFPLTEATIETNAAGDTVLTQWFERARFEWHPSNPDAFKVLLGLLGQEVGPPAPVVPGGQIALVVRVVDGDTIVITRLGQLMTVRLIGVDTPDTMAPGQPAACYGPEASAFTREWLTDRLVTLEKDTSEVDRFGRLLRYVWFDGMLVNERLVTLGYASASPIPPDVKYDRVFQTTEQAARAAGRGRWGAC
jgi:endonuclease YncB( thermonuclease family)